MSLKTILVENLDGKFLVFENDTLGQHLKRGERWEPYFADFVERVVKPSDIAVDVGANIGYHSIILGRAVGDRGAVFAFEPLRITFQQLCGNAILNRLSNIYPFQCAVGHVDGVTISMVPIDYNEPDVNIMNACVGVGGDIVSMRTIDSLNFQSLNFLKVDVQGCELVVLKGAKETIQRCKPILFIEIEEQQLKNQNTSSQDVMMYIFTNGYTLAWNPDIAIHDWIGIPPGRDDLIEPVKSVFGANCQIYSPPL